MMNTLVTVRLGPKVHILVPWNDIHFANETTPDIWKRLKIEETPAVYVEVNRG